MDKGGEEGSGARGRVTPLRSGRSKPALDSAVAKALDDSGRHHAFFSGLSREEKQLVLLRNELYGGSWVDMEADLRHRLERKPYIFRLMNRIEEDLERIARLHAYEDGAGVDLGVFLGSASDDIREEAL